jgi:hypothetical protein
MAEENKPAQNTATAETITVSLPTTSSREIADKVKEHDLLLRILLVGIVASIILLALDLYRNNSLNQRMSELDANAADYRKDMAEQQERVNCLSLKVSFQIIDCK